MSAAVKQSRLIDELMDRASAALQRTDYHEAEKLSLRAMSSAWIAADFERMARICLPLQESRRQRRHIAADSDRRFVLRDEVRRAVAIEPGCYLLEPPLIGIEARNFRDLAERRRIPVIVTVREPLTRAGKWPIVAVGTGPRTPISIRIYVDPPDQSPPPVSWFLAVNESLGDAAIRKLEPGPAAWRVDDLLHYLDAHPDHEKLHQVLAHECRNAANEPMPTAPRRRGFDDPFTF